MDISRGFEIYEGLVGGNVAVKGGGVVTERSDADNKVGVMRIKGVGGLVNDLGDDLYTGLDGELVALCVGNAGPREHTGHGIELDLRLIHATANGYGLRIAVLGVVNDTTVCGIGSCSHLYDV